MSTILDRILIVAALLAMVQCSFHHVDAQFLIWHEEVRQ